ncbi:MAG: nucleotidyltransferase family protein [Magnetococcales bacterium]|nr:nucleotidyltransferase family protein [Magnetococcales bacterium]
MTHFPAHPIPLLLRVYRQPDLFPQLTAPDQDLVLRQGRRAGLLGRMETLFRDGNLLEQLHPRVRNHLESARMLALEDRRMLLWEVDRVRRALWGTGLPIILLKGGAYVFLDLPLSRGRHVSDLDILMKPEDFPLVETLMARHGWEPAKLHPYDQRYYREWMHELPPLRHRQRMTELDIHHTILPKTSRLHPDPGLLFASAVDLPGHGPLKTLCPVDMAIHAAVHLFYDGDFDKGLRGLLDLDGLFTWRRTDGDFWDRLLPRARALDLVRPLYYSLHYCKKLLASPIPDAILQEMARDPGGPGVVARVVMDRLIARIMVPGDPDRLEFVSWLAWSLLYVRSHWLRMPPGMLLTHLTRKGLRRWRFDVRNRRIV